MKYAVTTELWNTALPPPVPAGPVKTEGVDWELIGTTVLGSNGDFYRFIWTWRGVLAGVE